MKYYLFAGLICGGICGALKGVNFLFKKNLFSQILCDLMLTLAIGIAIIYITTFHQNGIFRWYFIAIFALSFVIERKTIGKLFAIFGFMFYNWIIKISRALKKTRLGKIITK